MNIWSTFCWSWVEKGDNSIENLHNEYLRNFWSSLNCIRIIKLKMMSKLGDIVARLWEIYIAD
jgi:hypothetical protein